MKNMIKISKWVARVLAIVMLASTLALYVPHEAEAANTYKVLSWVIAYNSEASLCYALEDEYASMDSSYTNGKVSSVSVVTKRGYGCLNPEDVSGVQLVHIYEWSKEAPTWNTTDFNTTVKTLKDYINRGGRVILHGENASAGAAGNANMTRLAQAIGGDFEITTTDSSSHDAKINTAAAATEQRIQNLISGLDASQMFPSAVAHIKSTNTSAVWVVSTNDNVQAHWVVDQKIGNGYLTAISEINAFTGQNDASTAQMKRLLWNLLDDSAERIEYVEKNSKTVTFDKNTTDTTATNPNPATIKVVAGSGRYGELATCTRTAYTLGGWYTEATGGTKVTPETDVPNIDNHTLYAHWNPVQYNITYNLNGGSNPSGAPTTYNIEGGTLPTPTKTGVSCLGWEVTSASGNWTVGEVLDPGTSLKGRYGNVTLKAQWHAHSFGYSASGNKLTVTCSNPDNKHVGPLSSSMYIEAPAKTQYGDGKDAKATLDGVADFNDFIIATNNTYSASNIKYVGRGSTSYAESSTAPTAAGTYTAKITVGGATAKVDYTIDKAELKISADPKVKVHGQDDPALTYTASGLKNGDTITGSLNRVEGEDVGTYAILQNTLTAGNNYSIVYKSANLAITKDEMNVTFSDYNGVYDGAAHGITVNVLKPLTGYTIEYGTEAGTYDLDEMPTLTDVGTMTVYYKVTESNYFAYEGSNKITITPKEVTVDGIKANDKIYDGKTDATFNCSNASFGGKLDSDNLTVSATGSFSTPDAGEGKEVTITELKLGGASKENYVLATNGNQSSTNATITPKTVGLTWTNIKLVYNEQEQKPTATATGLVTGDTCTVTVAGAKKNVGNYTATASSLSNPNYQLPGYKTQAFKIDYANLDVEGVDYNGVYDGNPHSISVNVKETADTTTVYGTDDTGTYNLTDNPTFVDAGTYTVRYKVTKDNYISEEGVNNVIITPATLTNVSVVQSGELIYNGKEQIAMVDTTAVAVNDQPVTFKYSTIETGGYEATVPAFSSVGEHTVYYMASAPNHNVATGSFTVKIDKIPANEVEVSIESWSYGETPKTPTTKATYGADTVKYTYSSSENGPFTDKVPTEAGTWYVKAEIAGTNEYAGGTAVKSFEIKKSASSINVKPKEGLVYNGSAQDLIETSSGIGGSIYYAVTLGNEAPSEDQYTTSLPTKVEANTYYVWYKVKGDANHSDSEPAVVKVVISSDNVIDDVKDKIEGLPEISDITTDDKEQINKARTAYDSLTDEQKKQIPAEELKKLTDAETALATIENTDAEVEKPYYHNEWVDGQWYGENSETDYEPKGSWREDKTGRWYEDTAGWFARNRWMKIDGSWYFFDEDGYMATNSYCRWWDENTYWWVGEDGRWDESESALWHMTGSKWWFGSLDGSWAKYNGWLMINGSYYYFDSEGYLLTHQYVDGYWVDGNGAWKPE